MHAICTTGRSRTETVLHMPTGQLCLQRHWMMLVDRVFYSSDDRPSLGVLRCNGGSSETEQLIQPDKFAGEMSRSYV